MLTPEQHKARIQERINNSPFKDYLQAELNKASFVYLKMVDGVSSLSYNNKERTFYSVFWEIDDLCHQSYEDTKRLKEKS